MKCYYIVIEYLPGYSFDQMFLKCAETLPDAHSMNIQIQETIREGANKQVISSQADSLIKISRIWADFFPANTSNQPI
ncbi:hypothetical protein EAO04_25940 [Klebsiella pneumoniae]|nr:hypothetical protein EAO04_25940 [Klebsiella pneumoniae]